MDCGKWRIMITEMGATEAVTVMPRVEYELYVSGGGSLRLIWI